MIFAIVHYNTPELTSCLCGSIIKHNKNTEIIIFDNSDKRPFNKDLLNIKYIDNTKGQIINFNNFLETFNNKDSNRQQKTGVNFGSSKHALSIEWLITNIKENFILLDSDVLIKKPIDFIDNNYICCCDIYKNIDGCKLRCSPMICYFNVNKIKELNIKYFDAKRMIGLNLNDKESMKYDTGSSFYEDIKDIPNSIKKINMNDYIIHYGNGSWNLNTRNGKRHTTLNFKQFLMKYKDLWN